LTIPSPQKGSALVVDASPESLDVSSPGPVVVSALVLPLTSGPVVSPVSALPPSLVSASPGLVSSAPPESPSPVVPLESAPVLAHCSCCSMYF